VAHIRWDSRPVVRRIVRWAANLSLGKPDVRQVIHRDIPDSLESLSQEIGRAGRDDKPSICTTLYSDDSLRTQERFIRLGYPSKDDLVNVFHTLCNRADKDGVIKLTLDAMASQVGLREKESISAIVTILSGSRVVERYRPASSPALVKIVGSSEDPRFRKYTDAIRLVSRKTAEGLEFDLEHLAHNLEVSEQTIRKYIYMWAASGLLVFEPPYRGSYTKIVGGLDLVDFDRMRQRKEWAQQKLDLVIRYTLEVADDEKHSYLETYFKGLNQM
jgi:ATP-dependent DNA helicase RecQ